MLVYKLQKSLDNQNY